jgi:hypothetical protein
LPLQIEGPSRLPKIPGYYCQDRLPGRCQAAQPNRSDSGRGETGFDAAGFRTSAFNLASIAANIQSTHIQAFAIVFTDVRSASAAAAFALTWVAAVDKTRALNDRR